MKKLIATFAIAVGVVGSMSAAVAYSTDFETDQSANFVTLTSGAASPGSIDFAYDYSTYSPPATPGSTTDQGISIYQAPSGAGSTGVQFISNPLGGSDDTQQLQTVLGFGGDITMTCDVFLMHNGPAAGASGSTEVGGIGINGDGTTAAGPFGGQGIVFAVTGDGGSGTDARAYNDGVNNSVGTWVATNMNSTPPWDTIFPNNADLGGGLLSSAQLRPGDAGKKWVVWTITQESASGEVNLQMDGTEVWSGVPTATLGQAILHYHDIFTGSAASPAADQFGVFDNLSISSSSTPVELSVFSAE